jgi:hypothetical protein
MCHAVPGNSKQVLTTLLVAAATAMLLSTWAWQRSDSALDGFRAQMIAADLQPIASLLSDNNAILKQLRSAPFYEATQGPLDSFLTKIRRDGVAKHADMKQRLDQLSENNTAIVTLIKAYTAHEKTPAFATEADKFRDYASAWRDRWNSMMELFMAGGTYPVASVPLPDEFQAAVQQELAAAR